MMTTHKLENRVCLQCLGDRELRSLVAPWHAIGECSFCGKAGRAVVTLESLVEAADAFLRIALQHGDFRAYSDPESDKMGYEQGGDPLSLVLQEAMEVSDEIADAVGWALAETEQVDPKSRDQPFYADDQLYEYFDFPLEQHSEAWAEFSRQVTHRSRSFDPTALDNLGRIFGDGVTPVDANLPVMMLTDQIISRARISETHEKAYEILQQPRTELSAPAPNLAKAGRMNAAGIVVFYGALASEVAIAEVRPAVGARVVVGDFVPTRALRLLDLSTVPSWPPLSIFHPRYVEERDRRYFLGNFAYIVGRPIQPHQELLEYVPTQVVAEYIANVLRFDGVVFPSAQFVDGAGEAGKNVVLFHEAGAVVDGVLPSADLTPSLIGLRYIEGSGRVVRISRLTFASEADDDWETDPSQLHTSADF